MSNYLGMNISSAKKIKYVVPWHEPFIEDLICEMNDNIENKIFCELCTYKT